MSLELANLSFSKLSSLSWKADYFILHLFHSFFVKLSFILASTLISLITHHYHHKTSDTQGGPYGDGESKVVRNLTKPPMVSSELEFVTFMHARKLRTADTKMLVSSSSSLPGGGSKGSISSSITPESTNDDHSSSTSSPATTEGYIVVSRAIVGDDSHNNGTSKSDDHDKSNKKYIHNEILLGVNLLKSVPGEPNWTELTSVTHVYSPLIPVMLAKNAGVKGAVDFVRDIRALP